jgi:hypothetical protein
MMKQILTPGVENREETDFGAEMLGIGSNGLEGLGGGPEKNAIDDPLVLKRNIGNLFRHGKHDVKILGFQNLRLPVLDPRLHRFATSLTWKESMYGCAELPVQAINVSVFLYRVSGLVVCRACSAAWK